MPSVNLIKVVLHWAGYGEEGTIGWHLGGATSVPDEAKLADMLTLINTKLNSDESPSAWSNVIGLLPGGCTFDFLQAYSYPNGHSPAAHQAVHSVSHAGSGSSTMPPLQVAVVASLRTGRSGRSYRGRQYWPGGYAMVQTSNAKLSDTQCDAYGAAAAEWGAIMKEGAQTALGNNDIYWGVFSRVQDTVTPVAQVLVDNVADVQRRRAKSLNSTHTSSFPITSNP